MCIYTYKIEDTEGNAILDKVSEKEAKEKLGIEPTTKIKSYYERNHLVNGKYRIAKIYIDRQQAAKECKETRQKRREMEDLLKEWDKCICRKNG